MKKYIALLLTALLALSLAACGGSTDTPAEPQPVTVMYYHGDETAEHIIPTEATVTEITPVNLMNLLIEKGVLAAGAAVNTLSLENGQLVVDVNSEFATQLQGMGSTGEYMMLGSFVNTFLSAYQAESMMLTSGGEALSTGHNIYDLPLTFFED